jgi:osmotically-inducible protein OsmY
MSQLLEATLPLGVLDRDTRQHPIERAAQADLRRSSYFAIRDIDCEYDNGVLTLRGRLPSFFLKQMAQSTVARRLRGIAVVDNQLEVTQIPSGAASW